jgi:hypothetical protein
MELAAHLGSVPSVTEVIACSVSCYFVAPGPVLAVQWLSVGRGI